MLQTSLHFLTPLLVGLLSAEPSWAAPNPLWAVPFYKTPDALFPSGQAHIKKLLAAQKSTTEVKFYRVKKDSRQFWISAKDVVRDLHLSNSVFDLKTQKEMPVLEASPFQLKVFDKGSIHFLGFDQAIPVFTDLGRARLIRESQIRAQPNWKADTLANFAAGSIFKIDEFKEDWIEVTSLTSPSVTGFFPTGSLITKFDFAAFVYVEEGWEQAQFRQGAKMRLKNGKLIPLDQISALMTQADLLISQAQTEELKYRETLKLLETSFETWIESDLPGHGRIFWKQQSQTQKTLAPTELSTEELLERSIYANSFHPKYPNIGIVSAQGIYLTTNGSSWKKVDQFSSQNWPVLITPEGRIYVGDQMSSDWGKTFQHYFKWAGLMTELSSMGIDSHKGLKIASLKLDPKGVLKMSIQAGAKVLRLARKPNQGFIDRWEPL